MIENILLIIIIICILYTNIKVREFYKKNIQHIFYNFSNGLENLIFWFKIIWKDREFDYYYFYIIMERKLEKMLKFYNSDDVHICEKSKLVTIRQIKKTLNVLKRIIADDYLNDEYDRLSEINRNWAIKYVSDMEKQDMLYFTKCLERYSKSWWD